MKRLRKATPFVVSCILHLSVLLLLSLQQQGSPGGGFPIGEKGQGGQTPDSNVIPKVIEVEMVEQKEEPKPDEPSEIKIPKALEKPPEAVTECQDDRWYGGIGIEQDYRTNQINKVFIGYAADKAGLRPGDIIQMSSSATGPEIRGEPGTELRLEISRPSTGEYFTVFITREKICLGERR